MDVFPEVHRPDPMFLPKLYSVVPEYFGGPDLTRITTSPQQCVHSKNQNLRVKKSDRKIQDRRACSKPPV